MEVLHFNTSLPKGKGEFKELTTNPKYIIHHIHTTYCEPHIHSSVYFTLAEEVTNAELDQLQVAKLTASLISEDEKYRSLKNKEEREIFLLNSFGINSEQAKTVMTLAAMLIRGNLPTKAEAR